MSRSWTRRLVSIVAAVVILVVVGWFDTVALVGIQRTAGLTFDVAPFAWALSFGYLIVAGAVLGIVLLARWAQSAVVGLVYAIVGAFLVFLSPMIWLGAVGLNGAPPFLPGPLATLVDDVFLYGEQGPLNAVAIIGAAMLLVGLASLGFALRHRAPELPTRIDAPLQSETSQG